MKNGKAVGPQEEGDNRTGMQQMKQYSEMGWG